MTGLIKELSNKNVRITFISGAYQNGGIAAADYRIIGYIDGFLKVKDECSRTVYFRPDLIKRITVLSDKSTVINLGGIK